MSLRLGLQLPSAATTLGAGDPFEPSNLDFIDWEDRGAQFVAVNGRSAEQIRQDYHDLFATGLLDPFKNGSCLFFAGVTFATCFIPALARNYDEPVDNAGFVAGDHYPDGLKPLELGPYIDTELGFLAAQENNHSFGVWGSSVVTSNNTTDIGNAGFIPGTCYIRSNGVALSLRTISEMNNIAGVRIVVRESSANYSWYSNTETGGDTGANGSIVTDNMTIFARGGNDPTDRKLQCGFFGDAHPDPTDLRTALNDLFITKMGIAI